MIRPDALPQLVAWYRIEPAHVTTSSGLITSILDMSGNGHTLVQASSGNQAALEDDELGLYSAIFAFDTFYQCDLGIDLLGGDYTIALQVLVNADSIALGVSDATPAVGAYNYLRMLSGFIAHGLSHAGTSTGEATRSGYTLGSWIPVGMRKSTNLQTRAGADVGDATAALPVGSTPGGVLTLGAFDWTGGLINYLDGKVRELAIYSRKASDAETLGLLEWMAASPPPFSPIVGSASAVAGASGRLSGLGSMIGAAHAVAGASGELTGSVGPAPLVPTLQPFDWPAIPTLVRYRNTVRRQRRRNN